MSAYNIDLCIFLSNEKKFNEEPEHRWVVRLGKVVYNGMELG
jgi:hypothetical protein